MIGRSRDGGCGMLTGETTAIVLHSIATGYPDHALNVIATTDELDEAERSVLWAALVETDDGATQARRFGDALRSLGAERTLVNEAYRTAFYAGDAWKDLSANPLFAYVAANRGGSPIDKWPHYFPIYDRHLARFRASTARVLEIGVYRGGGLDLLRHYLGAGVRLVGIDIDPDVATLVGDRYPIEIGDQEDPEFLRGVAERHGPFDVVIDDGGHTMRQQITSIETLFPALVERGVYIVEDAHTSYWPEYADPSDSGPTLIDWVKSRIDDLHAHHHSRESELVTPWQTDLDGVHAYDSVVVLDRARRQAPFSELSGTSDYITTNRLAGLANIELLASREVALRRADEAVAEAARVAAQAEHLATEAEQRMAELESQAADAIAAATASAALDVDAASDEVRILRAELMATVEQRARLRADAVAIREELDDTNRKLAGSWGIIQEMRRSRSWRLTAPIRRVKSIFRGS